MIVNNMTLSGNRVMLITGGSRGIGAATAKMAGSLGFAVGVNYVRDKRAADAVVTEIVHQGGRAISIQGNVGVEADILRIFGTVDSELGSVTVLVNNAGTSGSQRCRVEDMTGERIQEVMAVNLVGTLLCCREAIRRMALNHGGSGGAIINVSSVSARLGAPNLWMDYAASKGGMDTLTMGLAIEVAEQGVRVNGVRPGLIDTEIHAASGMPDRIERMAKHLPMKRAGKPEEVAAAILWLASADASYVSGTTMDVAGAR